MEDLFLPNDNMPLLDRLALILQQCQRLEEWLPTEGVAIVGIFGDRVRIYLEKPADVDLLMSIESLVLQQARLMVGCDRVALYFAREEVCVLATGTPKAEATA